ncbi:MAG: thermonuclease family protein [Sphingopyxis sp.]|uniref:thermonuclease family protein n=1 Tax=Sphingopyxis sp. TaxID=1908224 RepID=UPI002ABCF1A3|nr:thermonuclease family protein [Sphingopyxis sp.]MDZ3832352.1 thermonuclease family protein [Sphingopyxis sp.]
MPRRPSFLSRARWRRRLRSLAALLLLAALAIAAWTTGSGPASVVAPVHIIDGDSLTVRHDGAALTVRLSGLDAVEYRQDCAAAAGARWPCGKQARSALEKLAKMGALHCDLTGRDRYRRAVATCRTAPFPDGIDLGAEMVRAGWAVTDGDAYLIEEAEARAKKRGIWQGAFTPPADWRAAHARGGIEARAPALPAPR